MTSTCQYPFGDPLLEDFHFCGKPPSQPGASYCEEHQNLCYISGDRLKAHIREQRRIKMKLAKENKIKSMFLFRDDG